MRERWTVTEQANFRDDRNLIWLASYPKSGNTWLRSLLTAYFLPDGNFNLNEMIGDQHPFDRQILDDHAGINSADLLPTELIPYQAQLHCDIAQSSDHWQLFKTHSAYITLPDATALFPASASAGAIVVIRNPMDIVLSYAHHEGKDADWAIAQMADDSAGTDAWRTRSSTLVPQAMASWSENVRSWLTQDAIPVHVMRYEDMQSEPDTSFENVLRFCAIDADVTRVSAAVHRCSIDRLRADEKMTGFSERPSTERSFFRSGRIGDGAKHLTEQQKQLVLQNHSEIMEFVGYSVDLDDYGPTKQ